MPNGNSKLPSPLPRCHHRRCRHPRCLGHPYCLGNCYHRCRCRCTCHCPCHCHHHHRCRCHRRCHRHRCSCTHCCCWCCRRDCRRGHGCRPSISAPLMLPSLSPLPVAITVTIAVAIAVPITVVIPIPVAVAVSIPSYYGWLLCVGWRVSDIMDVVIASLIVIIVIIVSPPSPAEEHRVETHEGGRGRGGNHLGVDTAPSPCCGRAGKASERMFSLSLSAMTSLNAVHFFVRTA
jgi:hypothetical protein